MMDAPLEWDAYRRLQEELARNTTINQHAWGLEAGLHATLSGATGDDADRAVRSERRRERHRAKLRLVHIGGGALVVPPVSVEALDARRALERLRVQLGARNWFLIRSIAEGEDYRSLSAVLGTAPGTLRARVHRLRLKLAELDAVPSFPLPKVA